MDYIKFSEDDYNQAVEAFKKRDLRQTSEKLWGAAVQIVKAVAQKRGWEHDGHAKLFIIIDKLVKEINDEELRTLFLVANTLHINFYEGWLSLETIESSIPKIDKFITKMKKFLLT